MRFNLFILISYAILLVFFALKIIGRFDGPLYGFADTEHWEYLGFYFRTNLTFNPFPALDLVNNQVFYPYGTNSVFQPWCLEREYFFTSLYSIFGRGPWLQIYYLLSQTLTLYGSYFLLLRVTTRFNSFIAGILLTFFNFYCIYKYPGHLNIAVTHWTVLSIVADFVITSEYFQNRFLSIKLIAGRILLLLLSLGLDLGYVSGFSILSFLLTFIFLSGHFFTEKLRSGDRIKAILKELVAGFRLQFSISGKYIFAIFLFITGVSFLYIPLLFQILINSNKFTLEMHPDLTWYSNPLRLFFPYFSFLNPMGDFHLEIFGDRPESPGSGSPGWLLLIFGSIGLYQMRKKYAVTIPFLVLFIFCISFHPVLFPSLKIFPWFKYFRVGSRVTFIYTVVLVLFMTGISLESFSKKWKIILGLFFTVLFFAELNSGFSSRLKIHKKLSPEFFAYSDYLKSQKGEAVLDWPFCVFGSDGYYRLCPDFTRTGSTYALRRFHTKKVVGQFFSRLSREQVEPFYKAGWDKILDGKHPAELSPFSKIRCLSGDDWRFFSDFYRSNDFIGIQLYTDSMEDSCVRDFHERFGKPSREIDLPFSGKVEFIPRKPEK